MNVLVSDVSNTYKDWVVVRSLKDVLSIVGNIDNLVYHKSKESSEDKIRYLNEIYRLKTNCKITYLCNKDSIDNAVKMLVTGGLSGKYVDDEFFLESELELNTLVSDLTIISSKNELSSVSVLKDFFNRYMSDNKSGISKGYLRIVKTAVTDLVDDYKSKNLEILKMSESAAEIFSNSVDLVSQLKEQQINLENSLSELRAKEKEVQSMIPSKSVGSSIMFFPRVNYLKNKVFIKIKDIGRCPYLISFLFGFREYLEKIKNVRPKLIVVDDIGKLNQELYKDYKWVTSENKNDSRNYYDNIVFTNFPTVIILSKLLDDNDYDTFIVLDRSNNYKEHILNSKGKEFYALSRKSLISLLKLPADRCIITVDKPGNCLLAIPFFEDYPDRDDQRINRYLKDCSDMYNLLYNNK